MEPLSIDTFQEDHKTGSWGLCVLSLCFPRTLENVSNIRVHEVLLLDDPKLFYIHTGKIS